MSDVMLLFGGMFGCDVCCDVPVGCSIVDNAVCPEMLCDAFLLMFSRLLWGEGVF